MLGKLIRRFGTAAVLVGLPLFAGQAAAQFVWTGTTSGNWSDVTKWQGGTAPTAPGSATTTLSFGDGTYTATNDVSNPYTLNALTFTNTGTGANGVTIAGGTLNFAGTNATITKGTGDATISAPVTLGANLTTAGGTGTLTLTGGVNDGGGGFNVIKTGTGPLVFGGTASSSFNQLSVRAGTASVTGGSVNLNAPTGAGNVTAGLQIGAGASQTGSVTISGGAQVTVAENTYIGDGTSAADQSTGTLTVTGAGTVFTDTGTTSGRFAVGNWGNGTLNVTAGAVVNSRFLLTNRETGSSATILVDGAGSILNVMTAASGTGAFQVASNNSAGGTGNNSTATVTVSNGGAVNVVGNFFLAAAAGNTGNFTVTGAGSTMSVSNQFLVGGGTGTFNVTNGGFVTDAANAFIGATGTGTINISGPGSLMTFTGSSSTAVQVGSGGGPPSGNGTINITNGGTMTTTNGIFLGNANAAGFGGSGTINVSDAGSTMTVGGGMQLGTNPGSVGVLNVSNGGSATIAGTVFAGPAGTDGTHGPSSGTIIVTGAGSSLTGATVIISGGSTPGGVGTLTVSNGGTATVDNLTLTQNDGGSSTATVSAGTVVVNSQLLVGGGAAGGVGGTATLNVQNGGKVVVGGNTFASTATVTGTINLAGFGSSLTVFGQTQIGGAGGVAGTAVATLNANAGSTATFNGSLFVYGGSTVNVNTGVLGSFTAAGLDDGGTSSAGTVNVGTGSTLTIATTGNNGLFDGVIGGAGAVTKSGLGTQFLLGTNTYSGGTNVNGGVLSFTQASNLGTGPISFNGGTLQWLNPDAMTNNTTDITAVAVTINAGGGTIDTNFNDLTFAGVIAGSGQMTVTGGGSVTLTGTNTYSGGTNVVNGTVIASTDANMGTGNVSGAALGFVVFTGTTTTTKSFAMNGGTVAVASGQVLTFDGSAVSGAILDGPGGFATSTNGAAFVNVTSTASAAVTSNSANDQFFHYTLKGPMTVAPGVNSAGTSTIVNEHDFTVSGSGSLTVGSTSRINVSDFQSFGVLTLAPGVTGQATRLTNQGTTPLSFNGGSRTFIATPQTAGQNLALLDLHGQNAIVAGGLFVNNGFVGDSAGTHKSVIADYGALVKGAGTYADPVITQNGGKFQAGNSPGKATFGQLVLGPGGTQAFNWQINNATGIAGPSADANNQVSGWSLLSAEQIVDPFTGQTSSGNLTWTSTSAAGTQFNMALQTLINPITVGQDTQGAMANFDNTKTIGWKFVSWQGTYTGPTDDATLSSTVLFDASNFVNPLDPAGKFQLHYNAAGKEIDVVYAVPEPGTLALVGLAGLAGLRLRRKKK